MDKVSEYIKNNWNNTVQDAKNLKGDIKIERPFMSPCITGMFTCLFYWDTYFINIGLLADGRDDLCENNIENIATFINKLGFMPNCNVFLDRSQPPLFTRCVWDYYNYKKDLKIIKRYLPAILKEYDFFQKNRMTKIGLNAYGTHGDSETVKANYDDLCTRVKEYSDDPEKQIVIGKDIMAIAESGMDFNMRFKTPDSKIAAHEFAHLDLNCILFDVERTIAEMFRLLNQEKQAKTFDSYSENRKKLIDKYFLDKKTGIYYDYNFERNCFSSILSVASLFPYAFLISDDKISAKKVLSKLELESGITTCEYRQDDTFYQWDYPCMWPCMVYFTYIGLRNLGLNEDATRIAKKYIKTVRDNFEKTGQLWEKYDARNGSIASTDEYQTPSMLGWTAGVYSFLIKELR